MTEDQIMADELQDFKIRSDPMDANDPRSLLTLLSNMVKVREAILNIPAEVACRTEKNLNQNFKADSGAQYLKISFWAEYRRAQDENRKMVGENIYANVCSSKTFYQRFQDPVFVQWCILPPMDEVLAQQNILQILYAQMEQVARLPIYDKKKKVIRGADGEQRVIEERIVNVALIKEKRTLMERLQDRLYGSIVQRQASLNLNFGGQGAKGPNDSTMEVGDLQAIEKKINRLSKLRDLAKEFESDEDEPLMIEGETVEDQG